MSDRMRPTKRARRNFDFDALKRICEMHETDIPRAFGLDVTHVDLDPIAKRWSGGEDWYAFKDNGASILAVAHLDTVVRHEQRTTGMLNTAGGPVVYSGALDDRLGAYTVLDLLPKLDINVDILLTVGEESGNSTAEHFDAPKGKDYNWIIEFDRGAKDVVMYQFDDAETRALVREAGAKPEDGIFSDIAYLEHLGVKAFNWGVAYQDYHSVRGHVFLDDYWEMLGHFIKFHDLNHDTFLEHERDPFGGGAYSDFGRTVRDREEVCENCHFWFDPQESGSTKHCEYCLSEEEQEDLEILDIEFVSEDFALVNEHVKQMN